MKFIDEFKEFISKGNAMDMAVGVVVGGAFTAIVNSLVNDVINPTLALITKLFKNAGGETANHLLDMTKWIIPGTEIKIGSFIGAIINFLVIAFVIFCVVKSINTMRDKLIKKAELEAADEPAGPTQEELLAEIRDLLKDKQ
ncbi:MAG: large conductance mechanosensitive channel protein MscL [Clostridia bacterium]